MLLNLATMTLKDERVLGVEIFSLSTLTSATSRSAKLKLMTKRQLVNSKQQKLTIRATNGQPNKQDN